MFFSILLDDFLYGYSRLSIISSIDIFSFLFLDTSHFTLLQDGEFRTDSLLLLHVCLFISLFCCLFDLVLTNFLLLSSFGTFLLLHIVMV
jgi:hypothetical protein